MKKVIKKWIGYIILCCIFGWGVALLHIQTIGLAYGMLCGMIAECVVEHVNKENL